MQMLLKNAMFICQNIILLKNTLGCRVRKFVYDAHQTETICKRTYLKRVVCTGTHRRHEKVCKNGLLFGASTIAIMFQQQQ